MIDILCLGTPTVRFVDDGLEILLRTPELKPQRLPVVVDDESPKLEPWTLIRVWPM